MLWSTFQAGVMLVQNRYQKRRMYTRIALGKNSAMDVVSGESSGSAGQLLLLYPLLFSECQGLDCVVQDVQRDLHCLIRRLNLLAAMQCTRRPHVSSACLAWLAPAQQMLNSGAAGLDREQLGSLGGQAYPCCIPCSGLLAPHSLSLPVCCACCLLLCLRLMLQPCKAGSCG
eukprot:GHRQ01038201.1.p1 GENE.GHRQ01038201.1~~GHRQ01038201.1.p1  ORF type:complete len:172 (+),score=42.43 GHRQ01038201.1:112-627(+)